MPSLVKKRGKNRYRASVPIPGEPGKRSQKLFPDDSPKSYKAAVIWEEEERKQLESEMMAESSQSADTDFLTVFQWAEKYMDEVEARKMAKKTYDEKLSALKSLIAFPKVGPDLPIAELVESELSETSLAYEFLFAMNKERGGNSANKIRKNLSRAWNWGAETLRLFPKNLNNPFRAVQKFPEVEKPRYVPPEADFWKVYDQATGQDRVMLSVFLYLAARRGEVFRMKISDIDFHNDRIRLWTRKRKGGSLESDWLPMVDELKAELKWWVKERERMTDVKDKEHIFICTDVTQFALDYYGRPFKHRQHFMRHICKRAGVKEFGFHGIRHLTAVTLYKRGYKISWIQLILRHKSATTTERYLRSLGIDILSRESLNKGLRRPGRVIQFPKKKKPSDRPKRSDPRAKGVRKGVRTSV